MIIHNPTCLYVSFHINKHLTTYCGYISICTNNIRNSFYLSFKFYVLYVVNTFQGNFKEMQNEVTKSEKKRMKNFRNIWIKLLSCIQISRILGL